MFQQLKKYSDFSLLFLRLVVGVIFIVHGLQKISIWKMVSNKEMSVEVILLMKILSIIEPLAGLVLILGIYVDIAALILAIIMVGAIAMKIFVFKVGFTALNATGWEFDLVLLASNLVLLFGGGGKLILIRSRTETN